MDPDERRQRILADIGEDGEDLVPRLSEKYDVSEMTIRRDLKALEEEGLVIRTYGGAVLTRRLQPTGQTSPDKGAPEEPERVSSWQRRKRRAEAEKRAIARRAAGLVEDGDILILEGGTTVAALVPFLAGKRRLTIVTHGLPTLIELTQGLGSRATIVCTGGMYHEETATFIGPVANRFFREFHAHRLFISATGFTLETGATDPEMLATETKYAMIESATEVILLLDSSKFGVKSLMNVLSPEQITLLITDQGAPAPVLEALRARGVPLAVVSVEEPAAGDASDI